MSRWKISPLEDIALVIMGNSPSSDAYNDENIGMPLIQGNADIKNRVVKPRTYTKEITKQCKFGDIIMTVRAPVGAIAKSLLNACIGRGVCAIRPISVNGEYLYQYLIFKESGWSALEQGSTFTAINTKDVKHLKIVYPESKREQSKISSILATIDRKISLIELKLVETKKIKIALTQKLFHEGLGIKDTYGNWQAHYKFGEHGLPLTWKLSKIGDISKVTSGGTPSRHEASYWLGGKIPWITTSEVNFNKISDAAQKITEIALKKSAAKIFPQGTVLMAMYGQGQTRGRVAILEIEAATNQACAAIICNTELNSKFCYHYLSSQYDKIRCIGNEGSQKNLNGQIIKNISIPCPPLYEQKEIVSIIDNLDEKIELLKKQKSETHLLKKGLMQKLLTGEWRVPLDCNEEEAA